MNDIADTNKQRQMDLFSGKATGPLFAIDPVWPTPGELGDFTCSSTPVQQWLPWVTERYQAMRRQTETIHDDGVPFVGLNTNTAIFAAAFGCPIHVFDEMATPACATPIVQTAAEADALPEPDIHNAIALSRIIELGQLARDTLGPDVPIGVPDIQSPFDIAALIWRKEDMLMALYDSPESVHRLVDKCCRLLTTFLTEFHREFPICNFSHCPASTWGPPELGCWLSEDEAGALSASMFEEFCLPTLVEMSDTFGGMTMHCCATADHQYGNFKSVPQLRGLNRVFQSPPGPEPAIQAFSPDTVLIQAWIQEQDVYQFMDMARPDTRFFFDLFSLPLEDAKPVADRLRARFSAT